MEVYALEITPELVLATKDGRAVYRVGAYRVFGRSDFLWHPKYIYISRRHFAVLYEAGGYYVEDLGSTNGTFLNGADIRGMGRVPLKPGDVIDVAGVVQLVAAYK